MIALSQLTADGWWGDVVAVIRTTVATATAEDFGELGPDFNGPGLRNENGAFTGRDRRLIVPCDDELYLSDVSQEALAEQVACVLYQGEMVMLGVVGGDEGIVGHGRGEKQKQNGDQREDPSSRHPGGKCTAREYLCTTVNLFHGAGATLGSISPSARFICMCRDYSDANPPRHQKCVILLKKQLNRCTSSRLVGTHLYQGQFASETTKYFTCNCHTHTHMNQVTLKAPTPSTEVAFEAKHLY
ncbi:hypothetical protein EV426DRAFT_643954 [Tirmania nivea]|nr:hypothetical protein EV426DRAFT_643954 [Tirmania nivea]